MRSSGTLRSLIGLGFVAFVSLAVNPCAVTQVEVPGLSEPVGVATDNQGVWHIAAANDLDLALAQGYVHCRDRFFQMDDTRREVDGTEAELSGPSRLDADIQARIDRPPSRGAALARRGAGAVPAALLEAYADGVNHCLATNPLPPEYAQLELTTARARGGRRHARDRQGDRREALARRRHRPHAAARRLHPGRRSARLRRRGAVLPGRLPLRADGSRLDDAGRHEHHALRGRLERAKANAPRARGERGARACARSSPCTRYSRSRSTAARASSAATSGASPAARRRTARRSSPTTRTSSLNAPSTFYEWHLVVHNDPERAR